MRKKIEQRSKELGGSATISASDTLDDLEIEIYTVARIVQLLLEDMQKAFGIKMAAHKQRLLSAERVFDKLFLFVHQALRLLSEPQQTLGGVWPELRTLLESLFPAPAKLLRTHRVGQLGKLLHWWEMLERPRSWLIETGHSALEEEVLRSLAQSSAGPRAIRRQPSARHARRGVARAGAARARHGRAEAGGRRRTPWPLRR